MYKSIVRPLLFRFEPEVVHKFVFNLLKIAKKTGMQPVLQWMFNPNSLHLETIIFGITFPNKVGIAAGLDKNAEVYSVLGSLGYSHVEIGTVTPKPQPGNPKPRSFRLTSDQALINRMGFNNNGLEKAIENLKNRDPKLIIGGNIGKNTLTSNDEALQDYIECFNGLYPYVDYIVVNVSCPNITDLHKLQDQDALEQILSTLDALRSKKETRKPLLLKISPDLNNHQLDETLTVIHKCNIDGVIAVNTTTSRNNLNTFKSKVEAIGNGGLSGKPIKDRSTEVIRYIFNKTSGKLPIIGVGGVFSADDALEKLNAGASLIQVYTGFIYEGPGLAKSINRKVKELQM